MDKGIVVGIAAQKIVYFPKNQGIAVGIAAQNSLYK